MIIIYIIRNTLIKSQEMKTKTKELVTCFCFARKGKDLTEAENAILANVKSFTELKRIAERFRLSPAATRSIVTTLLTRANSRQFEGLYGICLASGMVDDFENESFKRKIKRGMEPFQ